MFAKVPQHNHVFTKEVKNDDRLVANEPYYHLGYFWTDLIPMLIVFIIELIICEGKPMVNNVWLIMSGQ